MEIDYKARLNVNKSENITSAFALRRLELSREICRLLTPIMNKVHNVNYSKRFWELLLVNYVGTTITRSRELCEIEVNRAPDLDTSLGESFPTLKQKLKTALIYYIKNFKAGSSPAKIKNSLKSYDKLTLGLPDMQMVRDEVGENLPFYYPKFVGAGDIKKREKVYQIAASIEDIFLRNIVKQIPKVYVEHFQKTFDDVPLFNPEKKEFHVHIIISVYSNFILAKYVENGAKLYWYQHGAYYGENSGAGHSREGDVSDEFRTWGWKISEKDVPFRAYRLEKFKQEFELDKTEIEFDCLMCCPEVYDENKDFFVPMIQTFINKLDSNKYKKILARPRPINRLKNNKSNLSFITDTRVTIDSGFSKMPHIVKQSKLIVQFEVPATNFMECIFVNRPTIGILINEQPTEIIKPYYEFFMKKGVLHKNSETMVEHLNKIDVERWWNELNREPVFQAFKREFVGNAV